jgi:F-type H+-transporting ATPase subunit delta
MKINRQARRDAKALFQACRPGGVLDETKVRAVVQKVVESKPRGYRGILHYFQRLVRLEIERLTGVVESATALTPEIRASVSANLVASHGAGLRLSFAVDPALLGGLRVRVGSEIQDGTVAGRLAALREAF